jgi:hypothetical protein
MFEVPVKAARFSQYEVWIPNSSGWRMTALFRDLKVAYAVAQSRSGPVRLVQATYEAEKMIESDVIAELGLTPRGTGARG